MSEELEYIKITRQVLIGLLIGMIIGSVLTYTIVYESKIKIRDEQVRLAEELMINFDSHRLIPKFIDENTTIKQAIYQYQKYDFVSRYLLIDALEMICGPRP